MYDYKDQFLKATERLAFGWVGLGWVGVIEHLDWSPKPSIAWAINMSRWIGITW